MVHSSPIRVLFACFYLKLIELRRVSLLRCTVSLCEAQRVFRNETTTVLVGIEQRQHALVY